MKSLTLCGVLILGLVAFCLAADNSNNKFDNDVRIHLERKTLTQPAALGWKLITERDVSPNNEVRLILALKQRNLDEFNQHFEAITDPRNARYGQYLSIEEITEFIGTPEEEVEKVVEWLESFGITTFEVLANRDFIIANAKVEAVEEMLQVDYRLWAHEETKGLVIVKAEGPYSVPKEIATSLDFIAGVTDFAKLSTGPIKMVGQDPMITPTDLRERYNVTGTGSDSNSQAVAEFQAQYYSPSDLDQFFSSYVKYAPKETVYKVVGTNDASDPGVEASLDIQYIMGIAPQVQSWFYSNPSFDFWTDLTAWVALLGNQTDAPWVHSVSYGDQGAVGEPSKTYSERLSTEFQKLGARGLSIIFASGDSGTGCDLCVRFQPSFPATSPYVTSVGATRFIDAVPGPEAAVNNFGSGGGFSWTFDIPDYQAASVAEYLGTAKLPPDFFYNKNGRGTPDVAALGTGFSVVVGGGVESVAGTSCAAPTFSGVVALLNEIRLGNNAPTLGFLNPWLYQAASNNSQAFFDVTEGSNGHSCCLVGFECAPGWDPVTGLGTPNFAVLSTLL